LLAFDEVADMRFRLIDNMGTSLAFEHLNQPCADFRKWHLSAWPSLPFRSNISLRAVYRYQQSNDHHPKNENLSFGCGFLLKPISIPG
jgi:hypothetical protein